MKIKIITTIAIAGAATFGIMNSTFADDTNCAGMNGESMRGVLEKQKTGSEITLDDKTLIEKSKMCLNLLPPKPPLPKLSEEEKIKLESMTKEEKEAFMKSKMEEMMKSGSGMMNGHSGTMMPPPPRPPLFILSEEEKTKLESMTKEERTVYIKAKIEEAIKSASGAVNTGSGLLLPPPPPFKLTEDEKASLAKMTKEEKDAFFKEKFGPILKGINGNITSEVAKIFKRIKGKTFTGLDSKLSKMQTAQLTKLVERVDALITKIKSSNSSKKDAQVETLEEFKSMVEKYLNKDVEVEEINIESLITE